MTNIFSFLMKDKIIAPDDFNRWRIPPASIAIHLCIGSVYAWSIFNPALYPSMAMLFAPNNCCRNFTAAVRIRTIFAKQAQTSSPIR